MFKKFTTALLFISIFLFCSTYSQEWVQTGSTPEGGGVTEIIVTEGGDLFVTTASYNYPSGDYGGIRRSTDQGETWENLVDAYNGRAIIEGDDGNLYASVWPYPDFEGLYRSTDNGDSWDQLTTVPTNNNIFCVTASTAAAQNSIFAGTRTGVLRSENNGQNFAYASEGIEPGSWVYSIDVDMDGVIAVATSSGLYISSDNADSWTKSEGATGNEIVSEVLFYADETKENGNKQKEKELLAGYLEDGIGKLARASGDYLSNVALYFFGEGEIADIARTKLVTGGIDLVGVPLFSELPAIGGYFQSTDGGASFEKKTETLVFVSCAVISANSRSSSYRTYLGTFQDSNGGADIYYLDQIITGVEEFTGTGAEVNCFPNPFMRDVAMEFELPKASDVKLCIYNGTGELVEKLAYERMPAGFHKYTWDSEGLASGLYFYVLTINGKEQMGKLLKQ